MQMKRNDLLVCTERQESTRKKAGDYNRLQWARDCEKTNFCYAKFFSSLLENCNRKFVFWELYELWLPVIVL